MKRLCLTAIAGILLLGSPISSFAQNFTTVTGSKISVDPSGALLAQGKICFTAADGNGNPLNFQAGGGGQVLARPVCRPVVSGSIQGTLQIANPANTAPVGITYTVTVFDVTISTTIPQLTYKLVQPSGSTWNFDNFQPSPPSLFPGLTLSTQPTFNLPSPQTTDSGLYQAFFSGGITLSRVDCWTDTGTATVNLEVRLASAPASAGTPIMASNLTCGSSVTTVTSLSAPIVPAGSPLALTISAVSGSPNVLHVHVQ